MKVTFFRILAILVLPFSCSATSANAQYSVCCPASDADCTLPENQCNDYLQADSNQPSVENWIDRVSNVLQNDDANRRSDLPVKTAPDAATPIDFDCFSAGPCGGFSSGTVATAKATLQSDRAGKPQATRLMILREDDPVQAAASELDADAQLPAESLTKRFLTWSLVSHLRQQSAQEFSYWAAVKNLDYSGNISPTLSGEEFSYWAAVKDLDYSSNISRDVTSSETSYWHAVKNLDYSGNISQDVTGSAWKVDNRVASNPEPDYSQYDLYDVEASYLYGCFGYESIYGSKSLENNVEVSVPPQAPPVSEPSELSSNETIEQSRENESSPIDESSAVPQSSFVPFGAGFDGYLPYDVNDNQIDRDDPFDAASIEVIPKLAPRSETGGQEIESVSGCPCEQKSSKLVGEFPFTLDELILLPRWLQIFADQIFRVFHRWDFVEHGWQINNRIEMALCGSESLTVWRDAFWAHQKSQEVARELEIAQSRREKILSIAQTLDLLADQLKAASAKLISLAERESHKLIGRRIFTNMNR